MSLFHKMADLYIYTALIGTNIHTSARSIINSQAGDLMTLKLSVYLV